MSFQYSISHIPAKHLEHSAGYPFKGPLHVSATDDIILDAEKFVQSIISALPTSQDNLDLYCLLNTIYSKLIESCNLRWPNINTLKGNLKILSIPC